MDKCITTAIKGGVEARTSVVVLSLFCNWKRVSAEKLKTETFVVIVSGKSKDLESCIKHHEFTIRVFLLVNKYSKYEVKSEANLDVGGGTLRL